MNNNIKQQLKQIEIEIGRRLKDKRERLGMSRQELATAICVTHQQLAKYENGGNRISVSRLMLAANILNKSINYFLPDLPVDMDSRRIC